MVNVSDSKNYKVIGSNPIRHDGYDKVTGRAIYGLSLIHISEPTRPY